MDGRSCSDSDCNIDGQNSSNRDCDRNGKRNGGSGERNGKRNGDFRGVRSVEVVMVIVTALGCVQCADAVRPGGRRDRGDASAAAGAHKSPTSPAKESYISRKRAPIPLKRDLRNGALGLCSPQPSTLNPKP